MEPLENASDTFSMYNGQAFDLGTLQFMIHCQVKINRLYNLSNSPLLGQ